MNRSPYYGKPFREKSESEQDELIEPIKDAMIHVADNNSMKNNLTRYSKKGGILKNPQQ